MRLWVKLYQQLIITVYYPLMCIHLFVYKCVCVRGEAAARTAGGPLHRQGRPHVARVGSHHHHLPPTSWIRRCLSHSGPPQPPAPPARSREHSQFTLCLLTLVTFNADELFVVLPQPTRLKKNLHFTEAAAAWGPGRNHWQCWAEICSQLTAARSSRCHLRRALFFCTWRDAPKLRSGCSTSLLMHCVTLLTLLLVVKNTHRLIVPGVLLTSHPGDTLWIAPFWHF